MQTSMQGSMQGQGQQQGQQQGQGQSIWDFLKPRKRKHREQVLAIGEPVTKRMPLMPSEKEQAIEQAILSTSDATSVRKGIKRSKEMLDDEGVSLYDRSPGLQDLGSKLKQAEDLLNIDPESFKITPQAGRDATFNMIKKHENPEAVGHNQGVYRMYPDAGKKPGYTDQAIGYGIRVKEAWLEDRSKWPVVQGVKIDVSKGISQEVADAWLLQEQDKASKAMSSLLPKDATEGVKGFWTDVAYNLGVEGAKKNKKALAATAKGYTVQGMLLALDSIKVDGEASLGVFLRRAAMYNQAASEIPGCPIIESFKFGKGVSVNFSSSFTTDLVPKEFAKSIYAIKNRMMVMSNPGFKGAPVTMQADQDDYTNFY